MRSAFAASVTASLLALAALLAPLAGAAPTSNSVVNEYTERLPEGGGGQPGGPGGGGGEVDPKGGGGSGGSGSGGSGSGGGSFEGGSGGEGSSGSTASPLSAETERQLDAQGGEAGKNLSGIVQETGTTAGGGNDTAEEKGSVDGSSDGFLDSIGGGLSNFVTGSDTGLGAGFPILLGLILVGAVSFVVARGRSGRLDA
jgi:hypothetical protein